ncbi:hypothetical protein TNCV_4733371 [Trichonephila clavipes]|nr:hypothetical protein TNCV_4733371 [Trichonephila clavipes]
MRYSYQHTACRPPNPRCTIYSRGISQGEKDYIVWKHNYLRSLVAQGYERTNNQPPAANMMQMVWDEELATVAQKHADQCIFAHDCPECRSVEAFSVGQNIATRAKTGNTLPVPDWESTIQSLYDEVKDFYPKWISPFRAPKYPMTGHYTQFGLAIHQNDHQARRRFVEWAQNEIAVVPDFHKRILFSDEAHFWLNGYVNKQNCRIWSEANPQVYVETPLHPKNLTVWCASWAGGILLQKR